MISNFWFEGMRGSDLAGIVLDTASANGWTLVDSDEEGDIVYRHAFERDRCQALAWIDNEDFTGCPRTAPIAECSLEIGNNRR